MRSTQSVQSTPPKQTVLGKGGWTNALCILCILCIPSPQAPTQPPGALYGNYQEVGDEVCEALKVCKARRLSRRCWGKAAGPTHFAYFAYFAYPPRRLRPSPRERSTATTRRWATRYAKHAKCAKHAA